MALQRRIGILKTSSIRICNTVSVHDVEIKSTTCQVNICTAKGTHKDMLLSSGIPMCLCVVACVILL